MYDPDSAGAKATLKYIKVAISWMMDVYVVPLTCDPDEHEGPLEEIDAVEYLTRQIKGTPNEIAEHIREVCSAIQDPITAKIYSKKFADQYGVSKLLFNGKWMFMSSHSLATRMNTRDL